jgi:hypothetical protein
MVYLEVSCLAFALLTWAIRRLKAKPSPRRARIANELQGVRRLAFIFAVGSLLYLFCLACGCDFTGTWDPYGQKYRGLP